MTLCFPPTIGVDNVAFRSYQNAVNSGSWHSCRLQFSQLPKSCQQWEVTFLSTVAFRATKIPTTLRADVPVAARATKNLEDTVLPVNYRSRQRSFSELTNSCQQWELTFLSTVAFITTEILSTVGVDIPADCSFQSYQNPANYKSWRSCSFQSY